MEVFCGLKQFLFMYFPLFCMHNLFPAFIVDNTTVKEIIVDISIAEGGYICPP